MNTNSSTSTWSSELRQPWPTKGSERSAHDPTKRLSVHSKPTPTRRGMLR
ncbi:MAG: hypothetical protein WD273_08400 [Trueperaceae bacterium]